MKPCARGCGKGKEYILSHLIGRKSHWLHSNEERYMEIAIGIWGMSRDWEFMVSAADVAGGESSKILVGHQVRG